MSRSSGRLLREGLEPVVVAVIVALFVRTFLVQAFSIPTGSMEDNLLVGDHLLVNKFVYGPPAPPWLGWALPQRPLERGEVAVFRFPVDPRRDFVKRCVARGGDIVEVRGKGLRLNGEEIDESGYARFRDERTYPDSVFLGEDLRSRDNFGPFAVPDDHLFCLGDNRDYSNDSRFWGSVPSHYLKGRALIIYWSHGPLRQAQASGTGEGRFESALALPGRYLHATRWERSLTLVR